MRARYFGLPVSLLIGTCIPGAPAASEGAALPSPQATAANTATAPPKRLPAVPVSRGASTAPAAADAASTSTKPFAFAVDESPAAATFACDFDGLKLVQNTKVFAAGAYSGQRLPFPIDDSGHDATRMDVAVNPPDAPVVLMLGTYEPTVWNIGCGVRGSLQC